MENSLAEDIDVVRRIAAVPTILEVVCKSTGMGFAAVARVTEDRWIACEVLDNIDFGLKPGGELRLETTICNEIRQSHEAVIIDHVAEDVLFCQHPTPAAYGFQSYISMPILLSDGSFFGTLCAIDPRPARLKSSEVIGMFRLFAELIAVHIDARRRLIASEQNLFDERVKLAASQSDLSSEREMANLREQFIAVLGHDLRNPLAGLNGGTQVLMRSIEDEKQRAILKMMASSARRMSGLIDNVLDFARGRLGGGLGLQWEARPLEPTLDQVIDEMRSAWPDRVIETSFDLKRPVLADHGRLGQLFSNLLGNAVTHGPEDQPIRIEASQDELGLHLSVANGGSPIPPAVRERLFQPFYRGKARDGLQGLGLGLYIASEIARAHGGELRVTSNESETRFMLRVPPPAA